MSKTDAERVADCVNKDVICYLTKADCVASGEACCEEEGWYWWDEDSSYHGPYLSAFEADEACTTYVNWLNRQDVA